ncbi:hypothetical protein BS78_09G079800 [Paspalum vaginatum]|nr:hypothetical protein BS78_09G079800 [Paspalum vaginatum]
MSTVKHQDKEISNARYPTAACLFSHKPPNCPLRVQRKSTNFPGSLSSCGWSRKKRRLTNLIFLRCRPQSPLPPLLCSTSIPRQRIYIAASPGGQVASVGRWCLWPSLVAWGHCRTGAVGL